MKRMKLREPECLTTLDWLGKETSMASLAGSPTSTSSAQRITISYILHTESTLMAQRITSQRSITQRWPITSSSVRMPQGHLLLVCLVPKPLAATSLLVALLASRPMPKEEDNLWLEAWWAPYTIHLSISQKNPETNSRSSKMLKKLWISQARFPSFAHKSMPWTTARQSTVPSLNIDRRRLAWSSVIRDVKSGARPAKSMDGITISNLSQSITAKFIPPWEFHSSKFDKLLLNLENTHI